MAIIKKIILFAILLVPFNNASAMQFVQKVWNSIPDVTFWPEIEDGQELPAQSPALAAQPHAEDAAQDADMPPAQAPQPAARPAVPVPDRVAPVVPDVPEVEQQVGAPANPEDHAPVADVQPAAQEDLEAGQEDHEQRRPFPPGQVADAARQRLAPGERQARAFERRDSVPRAVAR